MPKNRIIIALGFVIALLPLLGFPRAWESIFQVIAGLSISLISAFIILDKRLSQKAKARARQTRKREPEPVEQISGENIIDTESSV